MENISIGFKGIHQTFEHVSIAFGNTSIIFEEIHQLLENSSIGFEEIHQTFEPASIAFGESHQMFGDASIAFGENHQIPGEDHHMFGNALLYLVTATRHLVTPLLYLVKFTKHLVKATKYLVKTTKHLRALLLYLVNSTKRLVRLLLHLVKFTKHLEKDFSVWPLFSPLKDEVYNHLSAQHANDSLYLCHQCEIPGDIRVRDFLSLSAALLGVELSKQENQAYPGCFRQLKKLEKFKVSLGLTELARRAGKTYYLFHNLTRDMPIRAYILLKDRMEALAAEGVSVVYLTRDNIVTDVQLHKKSRYSELPTWSVQVDQCKQMLDSPPDSVKK